MLPKRIVYFCLFSLFLGKSYSQVNLQTGSATFSLPMFNWQDDKSRLNSIVALSYNSGNGLKTDDVASDVGQGWNLIEGGSIIRMQNGQPDDQVANAGSGDWDISRYPAGILFASVPAGKGCPNALINYPIYGSKNQVYTERNLIAEDKTLDYFSFQFNGKTGMFVLDPTNIGTAKSVGDSKMKITFQQDQSMINQGIRTTITSFSIQDVDGLIYKFTRHGLTKVLQMNYCDVNLTEAQTQPNIHSYRVYNQTGFDRFTNPWVIGSWHLTEIEDALTHRKIFFNYNTLSVTNIAGADITHNWDKDYTTVTHRKSVTQNPQITSIIFPDGHSVTFNYGSEREDFHGEYVLSSVDFAYSGRYLSKYKLNTSYFIKNRYGIPKSDDEKKVARLCLRSVQKIGIDLKEDTPPYIFDYYLGSNTADDFVPPPFSFAKDIWGFFNGDNSKGYYSETIPLTGNLSTMENNWLKGLCFLRDGVSGVYLNPKTGYAKNGLLKQIIYPTGGTLNYLYDQNTGVFIGGSTAVTVGGVHVSQTSSTDGGYSNGCNNPIVTQYNYVVNGTGSASSMWGLEMPVNSFSLTNHFAPEYRSWHWSLGGCGGSLYGCCYWHFQYPGIMSQQQTIDLAGFQKFMENNSVILGILSITSTIIDIASVIGTSNPGPVTLIALVVDVISSYITLGVTCLHDYSSTTGTTIFYNSDLNAASPLPAQFKRVEIVENPGTIGKTVQEFTNVEDYDYWITTNPTFSPKQRFAPWAYGLPKRTAVYDASGNLIKETKNIYNFNTHYSLSQCGSNHFDRRLILKQPLYDTSCKCFVKQSFSQRNTVWSDYNTYSNPNSYHNSSDNNMSVDIYDMYTGRTELDTTYERMYKPGSPSDYIETVTGYVYNDENYEVSLIKTKQSDGYYRQKNIYYTVDFVRVHGFCYTLNQQTTNNSQVIALVQNNIISLPVETNEMVGPFFLNNYTYDKSTVFTTLANGDIKPQKVLEGRFLQPAAHSSPWPNDYAPLDYWMPPALFDPGNPDYNFYKIAQTFTYDASGNLVGLKDEGNRQVTNLYGYNQKYVVASVINADPLADHCAYGNFEDTNDPWVGWALTGTPAYSSNAITGVQSFFLSSSTSFSSSLNTAKLYTVSFWSTTSNIAVSGGTLVKSAPTINGFTYYEYDIAQGAWLTVVSGTGIIDELRLYPKTARMRTISYDPLIGKTAECDENGRITYYEYDNLGRLRFIKDENKNIVKMYEYNNVSTAKQNGCPGIYYSHYTVEIFTKNNCSAGFMGGEVPYTVAANMFSSTISQEDADAQLDNYIQTYGQANANTAGACIQIYYSAADSLSFTTENCTTGYVGGTVTYAVPAGRYTSIISQADANQLASDDILANGQAYANSPAHAVCTTSTIADWTWLEGAPSYCLSVNGQLPPHLFVFETDINPNSSTYNQTRWSDVGTSDLCPAGNYYNAAQSQNFTRNNCGTGYTGSVVTYTVAAGLYISTVSQAAANQYATNDINANGQNYANSHGTCTSNCNSGNCTGNSHKCVNGVCETGTWAVVSSVRQKVMIDGQLVWKWVCTYRYCFSDGSQSDYYEVQYFDSSCTLTCFVS